ncbi:PREDICTED: putative gustatory receptor clone PTE03 [Cyprinodon variegatus]|uniref:putative gustatory receptor clone PTE03 n=1 Tax=Cyprinodon variegatus TaxID=28743 RepID=UPI0007426766|nr:PREDICTED: putative gustatory receptor clone PTE03 [Cyprinodon variegatus]
MNSTQVSHFILGAYFGTKLLKYLFFSIILCLYVLIIGFNILLISVICVNRSLHEPMYMFLCSLFFNEMFGSTALLPFLLVQLLSDVHTVSIPLCFTQIFFIHSYLGVEFFTLTAMSYDRYLAICKPLQYQQLMTAKVIAYLVLATFIISFLGIAISTSLSFSLQLCRNFINKVYCTNYSIVKLACSDTTVNNIYGIISTVVSTFIPVTLIIYTYNRILKVCYSGSRQTRKKALSTCIPHLVSLINYTFGVSLEIYQSRFNTDHFPRLTKIFLSLYFIVCQPIFNPVMYGLNLSEVRKIWKRLLCVKIK